MDAKERDDYTLNSAKILLIPQYENKLDTMSRAHLIEFIIKHWKRNNPLNLSTVNIRLLEHYYRVAYANIFFSNRSYNIVGWKTARGEILIRYGQPLGKYRYLSQITEELIGKPPTEVWDYGDKVLAFIDPARINNYIFAQPWSAIVPINTHDEVISLRETNPYEYYPAFEGPVFDLSYRAYQFASKNRMQTDIYLTYKIDFSDTSTPKDKFTEGYDVDVFMFDENLNKQQEIKEIIEGNVVYKDFFVNSHQFRSNPQMGNLAFEMVRKKDKGVTAYHGKYTVKDYSGEELKMSDIVLASQVELEEEIKGGIKRDNIFVLPNPARAFSSDEKIFLYFEIYNLERNTNNTTDFEQRISIHKKEEGGVLSSLLSVVGLDKKGEKVSLTSKYQTREKDPQMYLQLDMSKYEPGEYVLTVTIKDKVTGKEVSGGTEIKWEQE